MPKNDQNNQNGTAKLIAANADINQPANGILFHI